VFDVSFGELMIIGAVTLIVVGPERMPKVARTAGMLLGRLQRFVANVKSELQQEMQMGELAQLEAELRKEADDIHQSIHQPLADAAAMLAEGAQQSPIESEATNQATPDTPLDLVSTQAEHAPFNELATPLNSAYRDRR
jgi:sec-independent protein translocase protein TatB